MGTALTALTTSDERQQDRWAAGRHSIRTDRPLLAIVAGMAAWLICYGTDLDLTDHAGSSRTFVESILYLVPVVAGVALTTAAARRAARANRLFWIAMSVATWLWLAAQLIASTGAVLGGLPGWAAAVAGVISVLFYVPAAVAALWISGRPNLVNGARGLLDLVVIGLSTCYVGWEHAVVPLLRHGLSMQAGLDAAYPVLDSMLIVLALSFGVGARQFVPLPRQLVTASIAVLMVMDVVYSAKVDVNGSDGHWLLLGYQLQACLFCLAAVVALRHPEDEGRLRTLPSGLPMLAVVVILFGVVQVTGSKTLDHTAGRLDVAAGAFTFGALVVRAVLGNRQVRRAVVGLEQARAEQERLAVTDGLTGLYNRRFFEEFLQLEAGRSLRHGSPLSLVVADLDRFKWVNDEHGHPAGDDVLVEAARRLRTAVRGSDVLARYGGEEFVVVLPETDPDTALEIAERCRRVLDGSPVLLADRSRTGGREATVTGSFGVATLWSIGDRGVDDLVRAADRALYRAKTTGRNRVSPAGEWDFLDPVDTADAAPETDPIAVALLRAAELIDADQADDEHAGAIARWSAVVADGLGLDARTRRRAVLAARLHDVGKLAIPVSVLTKPAPLDGREWALMRTHPEHSEALVTLSVTVAEVGPLVRAHHERFDGTGYPDGLAGFAIPVEARILAVCDAWAAMRADRVYAPARPVGDCRAEIEAARGTQFDPDVADVFLRLQQAGMVGDLVADRPREHV